MVSLLRYLAFFLFSGSVISLISFAYAQFIVWMYDRVMQMHFDDRDASAFGSLLVLVGFCYLMRKLLIKGAEKLKWGLIQVCPAPRFGLYAMGLISILITVYIVYMVWKFNTWGMTDIEYFMNSVFTMLAVGLAWLFSFSSYDKLSQRIDESKVKSDVSLTDRFDANVQ